MNAPVSDASLRNAHLLGLLAQGPLSVSELAQALGRDIDNTRKTVKALVGEALLAQGDDGLSLTEAGHRARADIAAAVGFSGTAASGDTIDLRPDLIDFNPANPRTAYDPDALEELVFSVKDKGVLQPVIVRKVGDRWQLVAGGRRTRAAQLCVERGLVDFASFTIPARISTAGDDEAAEIALVENLQREDLNIMDEAEAYLRLADLGRSAADIQRLVGTGSGRKKRSIQELTQFARELDAADKDKLRRGEIGVEQARFLVGSKRPPPALELAPRLALALAEVADAGPVPASVRLSSRPKAGPLITLADKSLIVFKLDDGDVWARVDIEGPAKAFLEGLGFWSDRDACLHALRAAVLGDDGAASLAALGRYSTPELNPAERPAAEALTAPPEPLESQARPPAEPAGATSPPAPQAGADLTAAQRLIVLELAHKLAAEGETRGANTRSVKVGQYFDDPQSQQLIFARFLAVQSAGPDYYASLTPTAEHWLNAQGFPRAPDGAAAITPGDIYDAAVAHFGSAEQLPDDVFDLFYYTDWLNTPGGLSIIGEQGPEIVGAPEPSAEAAPAPKADSFGDQLRRVSAETKALRSLLAAARTLATLVDRAKARKLDAKEAAQALDLFAAAAEAAAPYIDEAA